MTPSVWRIGRNSEDSRGNCFGTANGFRIFSFYVSVVDGSLVHCKTLIYWGQKKRLNDKKYPVDFSLTRNEPNEKLKKQRNNIFSIFI
jgi:hypothetical protein